MYYLTGTTGGDGFDYYTSTDMVTWEYKGALYRKSDKHDAQATAFWAPEVKRYNGRYYLTYSCTMPGREHRMLSSMALIVTARVSGWLVPKLTTRIPFLGEIAVSEGVFFVIIKRVSFRN